MSATKPQAETFPFDNELITSQSLDTLQHFAKQTGINLEAASEQMFRVPAQDLTRGQGGKLLSMLLEAFAEKRAKRHQHTCVECGDTVNCLKPGCTETEDLCYPCRKGDYQPTAPKGVLYKPRPKPIYVFKCRR